jgi:hypothetical protein
MMLGKGRINLTNIKACDKSAESWLHKPKYSHMTLFASGRNNLTII